MRRHEWLSTPRLRLPAVLAGVCLICLAAVPEAQAQRGRSSRSKKQAMMKQMQAYQQDVMRYQQETAAKQAEIVKQFDANGDGQLRGPEKSKFDKHMYDIQAGRQPNPFADILPPGQGPAMQELNKK